MIEYVKGPIAELTPAYAVVDCGGVGYLLNITLTAYTELQSRSEARLLVHEAIREDAWTLYGFINERERSMFRALIGVSGVGANTARMILSSIPAAELEMVIVGSDVRRLKSVKGIGAKTAERIIVDLRDKIKPMGDVAAMRAPVASEIYDEALAALVMLGFAKPLSQKVLDKIFADTPDAKVEDAIKRALTMM